MTMPAKIFVLVEDAREVLDFAKHCAKNHTPYGACPLDSSYPIVQAIERMDRTVSETERALEQERKSDA